MAVLLPIDNLRSGSEGGRTYSHNKGGYYSRIRSTPTNPNTPRQQDTRSILGSQSAAWKGLTPAQQAAWNQYGEDHTVKNSLGQDIQLPGQNWFCKVNARLADAGLTTLTDPPIYGAPAALNTFEVSYSSNTVISFAFSPGTLPSYQLLQVWYTRANSLGSTPNKNQARMVAYTDLNVSTPITMTLPVGVPSGEQSTFFAAVMNQYGQMSAFMADTEAR